MWGVNRPLLLSLKKRDEVGDTTEGGSRRAGGKRRGKRRRRRRRRKEEEEKGGGAGGGDVGARIAEWQAGWGANTPASRREERKHQPAVLIVMFILSQGRGAKHPLP